MTYNVFSRTLNPTQSKPRYSVCNNRPHLCSSAVWPNNNNNKSTYCAVGSQDAELLMTAQLDSIRVRAKLDICEHHLDAGMLWCSQTSAGSVEMEEAARSVWDQGMASSGASDHHSDHMSTWICTMECWCPRRRPAYTARPWICSKCIVWCVCTAGFFW